jgi:electron transfer flavoprotein beta subunit
MLVVAALRFCDRHPSHHPLTGAVRADPVAGGPSEADRCALEHALRLASALGGRCLAVTVGPPAADGMLRDALAAGAEEVLRVAAPWPDPLAGDGSATAAALVRALPAAPDLVVCGDHSDDRGTGSTPAFLAGLLGAAQALGLVQLSTVDGEVRALRRLDAGRRERLVVPLPAVCSVEPTGVRLRRAALPAVLAAATAPIPVVGRDPVSAADPIAECWEPAQAVAVDPAPARIRIGVPGPYRPRPKALAPPDGSDPRQRLLALTGALTERTPPRVVTPAGAAEAAEELLAYLRHHGYVQPS